MKIILQFQFDHQAKIWKYFCEALQKLTRALPKVAELIRYKYIDLFRKKVHKSIH